MLKNILIQKENYPKELYTKNYSFRHILLFWKKSVQKFIKNVESVYKKFK